MPTKSFKNARLSETGSKYILFSVSPGNIDKSCYFNISTTLSGYDALFTLGEIKRYVGNDDDNDFDTQGPSISCDYADRSIIEKSITDCRNGNENTCATLADCLEKLGSKAQGENARNWMEIQGLGQGFRNITNHWRTYHTLCEKQGQDSQMAQDEKKRIEQMSDQNLILYRSSIGR